MEMSRNLPRQTLSTRSGRITLKISMKNYKSYLKVDSLVIYAYFIMENSSFMCSISCLIKQGYFLIHRAAEMVVSSGEKSSRCVMNRQFFACLSNELSPL